LPCGLSSAHATSVGTVPLYGDSVAQPSQFQRVDWTEERRTKLRRAFWLIEHANADYNGHRVKAMEHIKKAAEVLGMDLHGNGYEADRTQKESDLQMRRARELLHEVGKESGGRELEHIRQAVAEIDHALDVR
jgi:hypothetical protein